MKLLYKAVASVSMVLLSTAAAIGVRRIAIASKKRKEEFKKAEEILNKAKTSSVDKEIVTFVEEGGEQDVSEDSDVVEDAAAVDESKEKPNV